jgi:hypothetical protein
MDVLKETIMTDFRIIRQLIGGIWYKVLTFDGPKPKVRWKHDRATFQDKIIKKEVYTN